jgi:hypothetical protein
MKKRLAILLTVLVLLAGAAVAWRLIPGTAPAGQPPLATLDDAALERVRADFNRYADETRVIVLLSPT